VSLVLDEHREYLSDPVRLEAYERAIPEVVRPGDVVLDLGAGTGILGLLACRAGAARVYAVEETSLIGLTRELARANGFGDRVVHLKGHSSHLSLPEPVDVAVCDQIGRFGLEAGVIQFYDDVRRRLLKPGGRLIPSALELWVAPAERPDLAAQIEFWMSRPLGFDFTPARAIAANTGYPCAFGPADLLAVPALCGRIDLTREAPRPIRLEARLSIARAGVLHGIGGWFAAALSPSVAMTNSPLAASRINRRNVFFPIDRPVEVAPGDEVRVSMQARPEDPVVTWRVEVGPASAPRGRFTHSTWRGMLVDRELVTRTNPTYVPQLTARGRARLSVLERADGQRTVAEIEQDILHRHPDLFPTLSDAAAFVAEVITRYTE
jgi:protein arginine N-methyltransferase 1